MKIVERVVEMGLIRIEKVNKLYYCFMLQLVLLIYGSSCEDEKVNI